MQVPLQNFLFYIFLIVVSPSPLIFLNEKHITMFCVFGDHFGMHRKLNCKRVTITIWGQDIILKYHLYIQLSLLTHINRVPRLYNGMLLQHNNNIHNNKEIM